MQRPGLIHAYPIYKPCESKYQVQEVGLGNNLLSYEGLFVPSQTVAMDPWLQYKDIFQDYGVFFSKSQRLTVIPESHRWKWAEIWWVRKVPDSENLSIYP